MGRGFGRELLAPNQSHGGAPADAPPLRQSLRQAYLLASTIGMFAANSKLISKSRRRSI
jgi:hypothetical protein